MTQAIFDKADLRILFIGNSHIRTSPSQLGQLFRVLRPKKKLLIARRVGGFLIQHAEDKQTLELLQFGSWDYVVLQGQKYSSSGKYSYPLDGALKLTNLAEKLGAKVILFPEWSRRDHPSEYLRINRIHDQIAYQTKASVAPIGQTWVKVIDQLPKSMLYERDGNHATEIGHFINACIFFSMIENESPALLNGLSDRDNSSSLELENQIAKIAGNQVAEKRSTEANRD